MDISVILHSAAFKGALAGLISAAGVDLHAFSGMKSADEFLRYSWTLAAFRWVQGAALGALTGLGYGAIL